MFISTTSTSAPASSTSLRSPQWGKGQAVRGRKRPTFSPSLLASLTALLADLLVMPYATTMSSAPSVSYSSQDAILLSFSLIFLTSLSMSLLDTSWLVLG